MSIEVLNIKNYLFEKTCDACPEQYDVRNHSRMVAYIRLRWGKFSVTCPDVNGETIYSHVFDNDYKGAFDSEEEREKFLGLAVNAIKRFYK